MPLHPLTNFEIRRYYQNERRFNGVYSRDNLPNKIKDRAYIINLDEYADVGTLGLLYFVKITKLFISTGLELKKFLRKLKNLLDIKT